MVIKHSVHANGGQAGDDRRWVTEDTSAEGTCVRGVLNETEACPTPHQRTAMQERVQGGREEEEGPHPQRPVDPRMYGSWISFYGHKR